LPAKLIQTSGGFDSASKARSLCDRIPTELLAQFVFGALQRAPPGGGKIFSCAIDIKIQRRHCRAKRVGFSPAAALRRPFERRGDFLGILQIEDATGEVESVALSGDTSGPSTSAGHRSLRKGSPA